MNFEETENATVSHSEAINELKNHCFGITSDELEEFYGELGKKEEYNAREVLYFLGY